MTHLSIAYALYAASIPSFSIPEKPSFEASKEFLATHRAVIFASVPFFMVHLKTIVTALNQ
ncbi:MAG: hypothetical protein LWX02_13030, partial [Deltaproteobacteria bacterium]|nr:hypothetical protein [Deltaproteobacteria bacterium]